MNSLSDVIHNQLLFLESCSDDELDPDTAVNQIESIIHQLAHSDSGELQKFIEYTKIQISITTKPALKDTLNSVLESIELHQ